MPESFNLQNLQQEEVIEYGAYSPASAYPNVAYINDDGSWLLTGKYGRSTYRWPDDNLTYSDMLVALRFVVFSLPGNEVEHAWIYKVKGESFYFMFSTIQLFNPDGNYNYWRFYYSTNGTEFFRWVTPTGTQKYALSPQTQSSSSGNIPSPPTTNPDPTLPGPNATQKDTIKEELEKFLKDTLAFGNERKAEIEYLKYEDGKLKFKINLRSRQVTPLTIPNPIPGQDDIEVGETTIYSVSYSAEGAFDPYDVSSISKTEICVSIPPAARPFIGRDKVCRDLTQIAALISGAVG